ncbi:hypothetical protein A7P94_02630 [Eikenella sp. NML01-A-086]|nr:hypothetical protein A7P94_02630 [Eikenella sp. NML01-A-086]OAM40959.1 hypothetical protein A7Q02_06340 [Eikenella sp. NML97-A-109]
MFGFLDQEMDSSILTRRSAPWREILLLQLRLATYAVGSPPLGRRKHCLAIVEAVVFQVAFRWLEEAT